MKREKFLGFRPQTGGGKAAGVFLSLFVNTSCRRVQPGSLSHSLTAVWMPSPNRFAKPGNGKKM